MDPEECANKIIEFIYDQGAVKRHMEIFSEAALVGDLGLSSLQVMELIEKVEDNFDVSIPLHILPDVNTIEDLSDKVLELMGPA